MDDEITITLRISAWRIVVAHLERGIHREVAPIHASICAQADPKIMAAAARDAESQAEAARQAASAAIAPTDSVPESESAPKEALH